ERLALASDRVTTAPPAGAGCDKVTVHVLEPGVAIVAGVQLSPDNEAVGARVTVVFRDPPLAVTVTVALEETVMAPAVAEKLAAVVLAATVTETGTVSRAELDDRATANPPAGATLDKVTVQVEMAPLVRVDGAQVTEAGTAGATRVRFAFWELPFRLAVTWATASAAT
ncbi:MAG: hypothetical protein ACKV22_32035, partial [Bryobacteraceae bacterium]